MHAGPLPVLRQPRAQPQERPGEDVVLRPFHDVAERRLLQRPGRGNRGGAGSKRIGRRAGNPGLAEADRNLRDLEQQQGDEMAEEGMAARE